MVWRRAEATHRPHHHWTTWNRPVLTSHSYLFWLLIAPDALDNDIYWNRTWFIYMYWMISFMYQPTAVVGIRQRSDCIFKLCSRKRKSAKEIQALQLAAATSYKWDVVYVVCKHVQNIMLVLWLLLHNHYYCYQHRHLHRPPEQRLPLPHCD